ncbi:MAG: hypothetical protein M1347_08565 [Chloroflexi bacterium]|nr:hypothetical protein [Chloroflexota bacterium]
MKRIALIASLVIAALLLAACSSPAAEVPGDLEHARQTLIDFFSLLSNGEYAEAIERHANDADFYTAAQQNNPNVDANDRAALMEAACAYQLRCLEIREVVSGERFSETEFVFVVEFANPDGSLFILGPCCGADETEMPPVSQFEYHVEKAGSEFLVHGSPVYVP